MHQDDANGRSPKAVFAIALTARASDERQTRNDNPHVLHADLRSRQVASIQPKGNADAAQIDQVCARFGTHAASGQSGLETCALVTFRCKTDITCCTEKEVRADAGLTVSTSGAARLIHPTMRRWTAAMDITAHRFSSRQKKRPGQAAMEFGGYSGPAPISGAGQKTVRWRGPRWPSGCRW